MAASRGSVLFIDDEPLVLHAYSRALQRGGLTVKSVSDSKDVPELLEKGGFDAIFSDLTMPGFDGIEILRAARLRDPDLPVVLISGGSIEDETFVTEAFRYLLKPIDVDVLKDAADEAVAARRLALKKRRIHERYGARAPAAGSETRLVVGPVFSLARREVVEGMLPYPVEPEELKGDAFMARVPKGRAFLAIDERSVLPWIGRLHERLADLARIGYPVAQDAVGAAADGLPVLLELRPRLARLHPVLTGGLDQDPERRELVGELITAYRRLDIAVVAPGVSSDAERDALAAAGCDLMQAAEGYILR